MDYTEAMRIDETSLDVEWLRQTELAIEFGQKYLNAQKVYDLEKEEMQLYTESLKLEISKNPHKFFIQGTKPTVQMIDAACTSDKKCQEMNEKLSKLRHEMEMAKLIFNQIANTKKAALENLVKLHGQMYFAGPSVPRDLSEQRKMSEQKKDREVNRNIKFRKKIY